MRPATSGIKRPLDAVGGRVPSASALEALGEKLADHHPATWAHSVRVGKLSARLAQEAGMSERITAEVERAATWHDVGKLGIEAGLLDKEASLEASEQASFRQHTQYGHTLVRAIVGQGMIADVALSHHERWDGFGYPHRLRGNAIPAAARLTAIVDVYDALRSPRSYKIAHTHDEVLQIIQQSAGHFDPHFKHVFEEAHVVFASLFERMIAE